MIESNQNGIIETAVKQGMDQSKSLSPGSLITMIKHDGKCMKDYCALKCGEETRTQADEWLCSQYYVVDQVIKQILKAFKYSRKSNLGKNAGQLFHIFQSVFVTCQMNPDESTVNKIISTVQEYRYLTFAEYCLLPVIIKSSLIHGIYSSVFESAQPEGQAGVLSHCFGVLANIDAMPLEAYIQRHCYLYQLLAQDPAGVFQNMAWESQEQYCSMIAYIARVEKKAEWDVGESFLQKSKKSSDTDRKNHLGYYIFHAPAITRGRHIRGVLLLWSCILMSACLSVAVGIWCGSVMAGLLLFFPFWEVLRPVLEFIYMKGVIPWGIPKMKPGCSKSKAVVVISTLLPHADDMPALKKRLEKLYFSNRDENLSFCILADYRQHRYPVSPEDETDAQAAVKLIRECNQKYGSRFMLFIRKRSYSKTQRIFCGWERKRGAITEWIRFSKGDTTSVDIFEGDRERINQMDYLIALDSDTELLFDTAGELIAAADHPLNKPVLDAGKKRVIDGYGILSPRLVTDLSSRVSSFSSVMAGSAGITAYQIKDHDMYQDLFGYSLFTGKGLIHVETFYQLLNTKFPEEQILSHDILEGEYLRTGFVSDVEMADSQPVNPISWAHRQHRWIRGDWQNILFLFSNIHVNGKMIPSGLPVLSRYKLFDNLRRSLVPVFSGAAILAALLYQGKTSLILAGIGAAGIAGGPVWSALLSVFGTGVSAAARKFFSRTVPVILDQIALAGTQLILLFDSALTSVDAILRSLFRTLFSRRNLLEWTTAAQAAGNRISVPQILKRYWLAELLGLAVLFFGGNGFIRILGILFSAVLPFGVWASRSGEGRKKPQLSRQQREELRFYCASMWRYYDHFATAEHHYLPPDNVQESPVSAVAARTSPTNIGMMMLSALAARDMELIDSEKLSAFLEHTLATVEKLEKWHGNLLNWYDTHTALPLGPVFVSAVDSGNFVCCLVALKEGLMEYTAEESHLGQLVQRVDRLIQETDLSVFYDPARDLFSIGYEMDKNALSGSHYDYLMSEARMMSYFAVARRQVPKKHWGAMNRTMSRSGSYAGPVSWTGTMFEFFMPHLLLPIYEGSLLGEAAHFAVLCQKKRTAGTEIPWGISESGFFSFDGQLNHQYKAHGVQSLGVKQGLNRELVISPYSTFLTLPLIPASSFKNLARMDKMGLYGSFGFYEAADFTKARTGSHPFAVVRSFMAHHIGMSILAADNVLFDGKMQERFMRDPDMCSAKEFLQERIPKDPVVCDPLHQKLPHLEEDKHLEQKEAFRNPSLWQAHHTLLSNESLTGVYADNGCSFLMSGGLDVTARPEDIFRRPQGIFAFMKSGTQFFSFTQAPYYGLPPQTAVTFGCEMTGHQVLYTAESDIWSGSMECVMHKSIPCERRHIRIENKSDQERDVQLLIYLEPILTDHNSFIAHPAFSKLFVVSDLDRSAKAVVFSRRRRTNEDAELSAAAGFLEDEDFEVQAKRERLFRKGNGFFSLEDFDKVSFDGWNGTPDACCAFRISLRIPPHTAVSRILLTAVGISGDEAVSHLIQMRNSHQGRNERLAKSLTADSPLLNGTPEGKLAFTLLPQILSGRQCSLEGVRAAEQNQLGQSALWPLGISGDLPMVLFHAKSEKHGMELLEWYLKAFTLLRLHGISFDLCLAYHGKSNSQFAGAAAGMAERLGCHGFLGVRSGIHLIDLDAWDEKIQLLLRASACAEAGQEIGRPGHGTGGALLRVNPVHKTVRENKSGLSVEGGVFEGDRFWIQNKRSPLPYSHILANPVFGTLLSDHALGCTWAVNSHENKLTPWFNDIADYNNGEMLLVKTETACCDAIRGAEVSYTPGMMAQHGYLPGDARYQGGFDGLVITTTVTIGEKAAVKYMDVSIQNNGETERHLDCAYYLEPVLGSDRRNSRFIQARLRQNCLLVSNPYSAHAKGFLAMTAKIMEGEGDPHFVLDRPAFWTGLWNGEEQASSADRCCAVVLPVKLAPHGSARLRFALSWGAQEKAAEWLAKHDLTSSLPAESPRRGAVMETPDKRMDQFFNSFLTHQILACRIWGRTAFYQCGGAYGFRDQLQDSCACLLIDPAITKRQIYRCCAVQFPEGDALHWWHRLPGPKGIKGVRTRYSDDLVWLAYTIAEYVEKTNDETILPVSIAYLEGEQLRGGEQERYFEPGRSQQRENVYLHGLKAILRAYRLGEYGLPLIGCGDWNDGYNTVGDEGKGQSVWLAMFLSLTMEKYIPVCMKMGDKEQAGRLADAVVQLKKSVDRYCWDGKWYLRAFYDDLSPMGSASNEECAIDSLPQSFAVLSDMPDRERVSSALQNALNYLVDPEYKIVRLFEKPFSRSSQEPGYVKAYPTGLRENGGQYTHAAVWLAMACLLYPSGEFSQQGYRLLQMLNPVERCSDPRLSDAYLLEPYYIAADIYTHPHAYGRGGWSMYTGTAAWYYRAVLQALLGLELKGDRLACRPNVPEDWTSFRVRVYLNGVQVDITARKADNGEEQGLWIGGEKQDFIPLNTGNIAVLLKY